VTMDINFSIPFPSRTASVHDSEVHFFTEVLNLILILRLTFEIFFCNVPNS
jgi:hypothetical protein